MVFDGRWKMLVSFFAWDTKINILLTVMIGFMLKVNLQQERKMIGRNLYEKRILAVLAVMVMVAGGALTAVVVQSMGDAHSGALVSSVGINSDIGQIWGINTTGKTPTYEAATLTTGTNYVVATFAAGFNVSHIVVFESDPGYDTQGLLNASLYYSTLNVGLAVQNATGIAEPLAMNLSSVVEMVGLQTNDTSIHSTADKTITPGTMYSAITVYSNSANYMNKTRQFSTFGLGAGSYSDLYGISIDLSGKGISSANHLTVKVYQVFSAPFNINLINVFADVFVVEALLAIVFIGLGSPRIKGGR